MHQCNPALTEFISQPHSGPNAVPGPSLDTQPAAPWRWTQMLLTLDEGVDTPIPLPVPVQSRVHHRDANMAVETKAARRRTKAILGNSEDALTAAA